MRRIAWSGVVCDVLLMCCLVAVAVTTTARAQEVCQNVSPRLPTIGDGHGTIVLLGGAITDKSTSQFAAMKWYLDRQARSFRHGLETARVAVFGTSQSNAAEVYSAFFGTGDSRIDADDVPYRDRFRRLGFEPVFVPLALDRPTSAGAPASGSRWLSPDDPEVAALIRSCHILYFMGGDQAKHARCLLRDDGRDTAALAAVREVVAAGGIAAGTSAGTHVMANPMFGWGQSAHVLRLNAPERKTIADVPRRGDLKPIRRGNAMILPGFGLLPSGVLTDTHFVARGRLGRLLVGMRAASATIGIGVDENAGLFIEDGVGTVVGENAVVVVEAEAAGQGGPAQSSCERWTLSVLYRGDTMPIAPDMPARWRRSRTTVARNPRIDEDEVVRRQARPAHDARRATGPSVDNPGIAGSRVQAMPMDSSDALPGAIDALARGSCLEAHLTGHGRVPYIVLRTTPATRFSHVGGRRWSCRGLAVAIVQDRKDSQARARE